MEDHENAITQFRASLASFAFASNPLTSNPRGNDSKTGRKRSVSLDEPDVDSDSRLSFLHSPSPKKKQKQKKRGYAAPETYAHLHILQDILAEGLDVVFCGINPGQKSAEIGHHFGHPTNHFWSCLHMSGFTSQRLSPEEDHTLPERFSLGLTNLVERTTVEQSELSAREQASSVPALMKKIMHYRPRVLCFIGLGIAKVVQAQLRFESLNKKDNNLVRSKEGLQGYKAVHPGNIRETVFYAIPSTSGRVVHFQKPKKVELFSDLRQLVEQIKCSRLNTEDMHVVAHS